MAEDEILVVTEQATACAGKYDGGKGKGIFPVYQFIKKIFCTQLKTEKK